MSPKRMGTLEHDLIENDMNEEENKLPYVSIEENEFE